MNTTISSTIQKFFTVIIDRGSSKRENRYIHRHTISFISIYTTVPDNTDNTDQQEESTRSCFRWQQKILTNEHWTTDVGEKRMEGKKDYQWSKRLTRFSLLTACLVLWQWTMTFKGTHCIKVSDRHCRTFTTAIRMKKGIKTNMLFNSRIQDKMASAERRFVSGAGILFYWSRLPQTSTEAVEVGFSKKKYKR